LFLNVATPTSALRRRFGKKHSLLPTMVYIHGGGYTSGSSSNTHPDAIVAGTGGATVVVTLNYRVNIYGFLGADAMRSRDKDGSTGNYGIQDQRLALAWVQDHISAFGADPSSVTIWGESSGGNAVLNHLVQPASFGLYSRVIIDSGTYGAAYDMDQANLQYDQLLNATGCSDIDCLAHASNEDLGAFVQKHSEWFPVIDGASLFDFPQTVVGHGKHNTNVPVLIGTNRDEVAYFAVGKVPKQFPKEALEASLQDTVYAANESELLELYKFNGSYPYPSNLGDYSTWFWEYLRISTDGGISAGPGQPSMGLGHCSARCVAKGLVAGGTPSVFFYNFQHPTNDTILDFNVGNPIPGTYANSPFVPHASELPYAFSMLDELDPSNGERELAKAMSAYWTKFAELGDPNRDGLPAWPRWEPDTDATQILDVGVGGIASIQHLRAAACDFFDRQPHSACAPPALREEVV